MKTPNSTIYREIQYDERFIKRYELRTRIMGGVTILGLTGLGAVIGGLCGDSKLFISIGAGTIGLSAPLALILANTARKEEVRYREECEKRDEKERRFRSFLGVYREGDFSDDS